ncbi:hypothetical protein RCH06_001876 [Polaromonas sp. CG_9.5]|uniref:hypothetical protein n=1 Tax=Polaromonas sp. CG_9.5 TaxID=3071705 RepID=UPI002E0741BC|nr:hypothetical protein [Polaromonas sp. CG_9.5]
MPFSIKIAGANFTNVVDKTVPYASLMSGFWLFGGDQAQSLKNLAPNAIIPNASLVGTGVPAYRQGYVEMSFAGDNASAINSGITLNPTHPFTYIVVADLITGGAGLQRGLCGTWHSGITGSDIVQGFSPSTRVGGAFSGGAALLTAPISTLAAGSIGFAASSASAAAGPALYTHDGTGMQAITGAAVVAPAVNTFRIGPFGARPSSTSQPARWAASMLFPSVMTQAQLLELRDYLKFKLEKRGVVMV